MVQKACAGNTAWAAGHLWQGAGAAHPDHRRAHQLQQTSVCFAFKCWRLPVTNLQTVQGPFKSVQGTALAGRSAFWQHTTSRQSLHSRFDRCMAVKLDYRGNEQFCNLLLASYLSHGGNVTRLVLTAFPG
jgi:hypothetical protein